MTIGSVLPSFLEAVARQRELASRRAAAILASPEIASGQQSPELQQLVGLLAAALEELKVVEEEVLLQHDDFAETTAKLSRRAAYHQLLFEQAPVALVVTDALGMIREVNAAATAMLRRDAERLIGKPFTILVPRGERQEFRTGLVRLSLASAVDDWRMKLLRPTDSALQVVAGAQVAPALFDGRPGVIWTLRSAAERPVALGAPAAASRDAPTEAIQLG